MKRIIYTCAIITLLVVSCTTTPAARTIATAFTTIQIIGTGTNRRETRVLIPKAITAGELARKIAWKFKVLGLKFKVLGSDYFSPDDVIISRCEPTDPSNTIMANKGICELPEYFDARGEVITEWNPEHGTPLTPSTAPLSVASKPAEHKAPAKAAAPAAPTS